MEHASAQYHLGLALTDAGRLDEAEAALRQAARLFDPDRLRAEHARAVNALGAVLRMAGRPEQAAQAFSRAVACFEASGAALEQGAALFNLGLAHRESGEVSAAADCFGEAGAIFEEGKAIRQTAAAARELGSTYFIAGDLDFAARALEHSISLADRAGDHAALAAAANTLGLVHLASGRPEAAIRTLERAVGGNPMSVRPEGYAMAKANLALAYEQAGDELSARIAARQALGLPEPPEPVRAQAAELAERLGGGPGDLLLLLGREPQERWPHIVREEVARWIDLDAARLREEAAAWVAGQLDRATVAVELSEALIGALLELPPDQMEVLIRAVVEALGDRGPRDRDRFRSAVSMAMARFHVPQLMRLQATFNRISAELGEESSWS